MESKRKFSDKYGKFFGFWRNLLNRCKTILFGSKSERISSSDILLIPDSKIDPFGFDPLDKYKFVIPPGCKKCGGKGWYTAYGARIDPEPGKPPPSDTVVCSCKASPDKNIKCWSEDGKSHWWI